MKRFVLLALFLVLAACREDHSWHQKLTLVVETPTGPVSGSSVVEVRVGFYEDPPPLTSTEVVYGLTGEATVVEVAPGRYLFALMGNSEELFFYAAKDRFKGLTRGEWLRLIPDQTEPVTLTGDLIPMLVTFADITRPETVREVDPADLDATFGCDRDPPCYRIAAATLEITEEPVTGGKLRALLTWLGPHPESPVLSKIEPTDFSFAAKLRQGSFIREQ